jgi:hypothetical protein
VYAQSYANGTAYNEELAATPLSTARIYDSIYVRHWDTWLTTTFNAVFSGILTKKKGGQWANSRYSLDAPLKNLVSGVKNLESPYPPFGDSSDYDLSPNGIWVTFKSKAPELPRANHTASYIYLVSHDGSVQPEAINGPDSPGTPHGIKGDTSSPSFSPDSRHIAYFQMGNIAYESDRRVLYVYTLHSKKTIPAVAKDWDRSPDSVKWTADGKNLIVHSEDHARGRLFFVPVDAGNDYKPQNFTNTGFVSGFRNLPNGDVLITGSAIWTSWTVYTANPKDGVINTLISANEVDPALKGLSPADVDEFYYQGNWTKVSYSLSHKQNFVLIQPDSFLAHLSCQL